MKAKKCIWTLWCFLSLLVASCSEEKESPQPIKLSMEETISVVVGQMRQLTLRIDPKGDYDVTWVSADETIASVDGGQVTGVSVGETQVTATVQGCPVTCDVTVIEKPEEGILKLTMEQALNLDVGETYQLNLEVEPEGEYEVLWESSDEAIVSVSTDGIITAKAVGEVQIMATVEGEMAVCRVIVSEGLPDESEAFLLDLDSYPNKEAVKEAIQIADARGIIYYKVLGDFSKLGVKTEYRRVGGPLVNVENPFYDTRVQIIDFSATTNFPEVQLSEGQGEDVMASGLPEGMFGDFPNNKYGQRCPKLSCVILPNEVKAIGFSAFEACSMLRKVVMQGVEIVGANGFMNCFNLEAIDLPVAKKIKQDGFYNCSGLKTIRLPLLEEIEEWGVGGYVRQSAYRDVLDLPSVKKLGSSALVGIQSEIINLPNLLEIGGDVFAECDKLLSMTLLMETIPTQTFDNCTNLRSVKLPNATFLASTIFRECSSLEELFLISPKSITLQESVWGKDVWEDFKNSQNCTLYLHQNKKEIGTSTPKVEFGNRWGGQIWKEIKYVDNNGNLVD